MVMSVSSVRSSLGEALSTGCKSRAETIRRPRLSPAQCGSGRGRRTRPGAERSGDGAAAGVDGTQGADATCATTASGQCRVCDTCVRDTPGVSRPGLCRTQHIRLPRRVATQHHFTARIAQHSAVVSLLLLGSLVTSVRGSPVKRSWRDPCDLEAAAAAASGKGTSEAKLLDQIISVIDVIRPKVNQLMNKFLELTYPAKDEAEMLRDWGQHNVSWLVFVRETMAAHGGAAERLEATAALPRLFGDLQRLAVGLEQAALEAALAGTVAAMDIFRALQAGLLQLLCELQLALLEKQLKPDSPKVADILSQDSPDLDQSRERNLRNWVLMREYKAYIAHVHAVIRKLRESSAAGR